MDYRLAYLTGIDIPIPELEAQIHQPTIKEISMVGEEDFFQGLQYLWVDKNILLEDENLISQTSNFNILMTILEDKENGKKVRSAISSVLKLCFSSDSFIQTPRSLLLNNNGKNIIIDENNFDIVQDFLKEIFCYRTSEGDAFNPANEAAQAIAKKLMEGRRRVAAQKAVDQKGSILSRYVSILAIGLKSMSLQDLLSCTIYQLYDLLERFNLYTTWDLDIRQRLAGGNPDSHPDDWMKNIH